MKNLTYLKYGFWAYGVLFAFTVLLVCAGGGFTLATGGEDAMPAGIGLLVVSLGLAVLCLLNFAAGSKAARGQGRILISVLSLMLIGNCPGIFLAGYAIWVCWVNEETKKVFDDPLEYDLF